jgi:serine/threonine protein kinase
MVMDYCNRGSIRKALDRKTTPFTDKVCCLFIAHLIFRIRISRSSFLMQEIWIYLSQFIIALTELQQFDRIHGNIKPENIFIGQNNTFKFGLFTILFLFIPFSSGISFRGLLSSRTLRCA